MRDSAVDRSPLEGRPPGRGALAIRRPSVLVPIAAIGLAALFVTVVRWSTPDPTTLELDLSASEGAIVAVWMNGISRDPMLAAVVAGKRHRYLFTSVVDDLTMLRIDPTDVGNATVELYGVTITQRGNTIARFDARALSTWARASLDVIAANETSVTFRTATQDPILTTPVDVPVDASTGRFTGWISILRHPEIIAALVALALVLVTATASLDRSRRMYPVVAVLALALAAVILWIEPTVPHEPASAAVAVSRATFIGSSTRPAGLLTIALVAGAGMIGLAAALVHRPGRYRQAIDEAAGLKPWQAAIGVAIVALLTAPDLSGWASAIATQRYMPHWDHDNLLYWRYLLAEGRWPMRDFWYPYGGGAVFELPFPAGPTFRWLYVTALFSTFFLALGAWRGPAAAGLGLALLLVGRHVALFDGEERYLLALTVVLAYVAGRGAGAGSVRKAIFWAACALALFVEPPQLVYAAMPVAAIWALRLVTEPGRTGSWTSYVARRWWEDFGPPLLIAVSLCALYFVTGQLAGYIELYAHLGDAVAYSAWPVGLPPLTLDHAPPSLVLFALSGVLIALSVYEYFGGSGRYQYGEALAGVGLVALAVIQKHFMRSMEVQLVFYIAVSVLVLVIGSRGTRRFSEYATGSLLLGAVVAMIALRPGAVSLSAQVIDASRRVVSNVGILASGSAVAASANEARFALDRFSRFQHEQRAIEIMRSHAGPDGDVRLFALTDEMPLYLLARQRSVWLSNMYDASPLYRQQRVVQWLRDERPPFAAFQRDHLLWDGFHMSVRVPLVYAEVVSTYVPLETEQRIQVLRRRRDDEPVALGYWRDQLGAGLNLGRIPSVSSYTAEEPCTLECAEVLDVDVPEGGSGEVRVTLNAGGFPFTLTLTHVPDETRYTLVLDRVWFWDVAKRAGLSRSLDLAPGSPARLSLRTAPLKADVLY